MEPLSTHGGAIETRRRASAARTEKRAVIASTVRLIVGVALAIGLFLVFFGFRIIHGNGMYPALSDGDLVLTYRTPSFRKGEIVFYQVSGRTYCGRVAAVEGDVVDFPGDGKIYVNGTAQTTDVFFPTDPPENWEGRTVVPAGTVFLLGDFRIKTEDSRHFGFIPKSDVTGKAIAILRHKTM